MANNNSKVRQYRMLLEEFCTDIEASGVVHRDDGIWRPVGDPDWTDLGATYLKACAILKRKPVFKQP